MKKIIHAFARTAVGATLAALLGAAALPSRAQTAPLQTMSNQGTATPAMPAVASDALYQALGAKPGLEALMGVFVAGLKADTRIGVQFKDTKSSYLQEQLVDQICMVSGGPCAYKGADMKTSHANMEITKAQFNALVEVLQVAMDRQGIAFATQNQLLARLAPMHRDVITAR
jgi:hemoglobin